MMGSRWTATACRRGETDHRQRDERYCFRVGNTLTATVTIDDLEDATRVYRPSAAGVIRPWCI